jgi:hypothetical protein
MHNPIPRKRGGGIASGKLPTAIPLPPSLAKPLGLSDGDYDIVLNTARPLAPDRRERPRSRAAEQRYEVAPFWIELHAIPHAEWGPHRRISNWRRPVSG